MFVVVVDWKEAWRIRRDLEDMGCRTEWTDSRIVFRGGVMGKEDWVGDIESCPSREKLLLFFILGDSLSSEAVVKLSLVSSMVVISWTSFGETEARAKKATSVIR